MFNIIVAICLIILIILNIIKLKNDGQFIKGLIVSQITPDVFTFEKKLVNSYIDEIFYQELLNLLNSNHNLVTSKKSKHSVSRLDYKELVTCLNRDDIGFLSDDNESFGESFKNVFITKIYMRFLSEVPNNIKKLIFKYHSGFSIDTYKKKKIRPSYVYYLTSYVSRIINRLYIENEEYMKEIYYKNIEDIKTHTNELNNERYIEIYNRVYNIETETNKKEVTSV